MRPAVSTCSDHNDHRPNAIENCLNQYTELFLVSKLYVNLPRCVDSEVAAISKILAIEYHLQKSYLSVCVFACRQMFSYKMYVFFDRQVETIPLLHYK